jgi:hypothetical protein
MKETKLTVTVTYVRAALKTEIEAIEGVTHVEGESIAEQFTVTVQSDQVEGIITQIKALNAVNTVVEA